MTVPDNSILVRLARPEDAPVIVDYNIQLARESEHKQLDPRKITPGVAAVLEDPHKGRYFVAECAGKILGQVMHTWEWSDWRNGQIWWLQSVYVHPDYRRQGVFRSLLTHVLELARQEPGVIGIRLYVEQENHRAQATYSRLGFAPGGYHVLEYWLGPRL